LAFPSDDRLARDLAVAAGQRLLKIRAAGSGEAVRQAGDLGSQDFLAAELARARPGDAVLSEEAADDLGRLSADRVWIIDPLDGTREFGEPGRTDWAVHVALWERGASPGGRPPRTPRGASPGGRPPRTPSGDLTAGAVALPARGEVLSTAEPPAVPSSQAAENGIRIVVSRSRPPEFTRRLADKLGAELVPLGSAGAKAAAVITGRADAYVHSGGQHEWDTAAPVAVARSAGLHACRIDGSSLRYNSEKPWMPDILICPAPLASRLLNAISAVSPCGRA
jgi:3'(2'), 5'-bisphosphate nucleotidase